MIKLFTLIAVGQLKMTNILPFISIFIVGKFLVFKKQYKQRLIRWNLYWNSISSGSFAAQNVVDTKSTSCGNCVFPFIFNGRLINTCTTIDGDATPWCATSVDASGNYGGTWEFCEESSCPGVATPSMSVNPSNAVGSCCKYKVHIHFCQAQFQLASFS